jgi:hypothetical protein
MSAALAAPSGYVWNVQLKKVRSSTIRKARDAAVIHHSQGT